MKCKAGIIGIGNVGSHVAHCFVKNNVCNELVLIDINEKKAYADKLDICDSVAYLNNSINIKLNDYSELADADIVVISAGQLPDPKQSRLKALGVSVSIVDSIMANMVDSGFKGIYIVITNPCDIITYHVLKKSRFPSTKVIGTGTMLDSGRFKRITAELLSLEPKAIQGYTLGEHGDSQMIPWSHIYAGNMPVKKYAEKNNIILDYDKIRKDTAYAGYDVLMGKGATFFGIAEAAAVLAKAILNNEKSILPVSTFLTGEYGVSDICMSIPCVIGSEGIEKKLVLDLPQDELDELVKSANILKEVCKSI